MEDLRDLKDLTMRHPPPVLVFKAHRLCASLNSNLESNKDLRVIKKKKKKEKRSIELFSSLRYYSHA